MEVAALVAIVLAATQTIKKGLEALTKKPLTPVAAWILSAVVALFVVSFKAVETSTPFNFALLVTFATVVMTANGGFLLLKKLVGLK